MVPRWGVLYATCKLLTNRYAGNVFIRDKATGHMFVDHYLDPIFPITKSGNLKAVVKSKGGQANGSGDGNVLNGNGHLEEALSYLDAVVDVDDAIPLKRRNSTPPKSLAELRDQKDYGRLQSHQNPASTNGNARPSTHGMVDGFDAIGGDALMEQAVRGKTVKELSRLWRYLGGKSPEEMQKQDSKDRASERPFSQGRRDA